MSFVKPSKPSLQAQCLFPAPTYIQKHPENSACVAVFPSCANLEGSVFFIVAVLGRTGPSIIKPHRKAVGVPILCTSSGMSLCVGSPVLLGSEYSKTTGLYLLNGHIGLAELPYRTGRGH